VIILITEYTSISSSSPALPCNSCQKKITNPVQTQFCPRKVDISKMLVHSMQKCKYYSLHNSQNLDNVITILHYYFIFWWSLTINGPPFH